LALFGTQKDTAGGIFARKNDQMQNAIPAFLAVLCGPAQDGRGFVSRLSF
jgi:hypothetical protein